MGPDRRLGAPNLSPLRPNGVTIRSQGTKAPVKMLEARDRRSPLTTRRMSRIAKGSLLQGPLFSKQALAQITKSGGVRFHFRIASRANERAAGGCAPMLALSYPNEASLRDRIDIDRKHSRAIVQEIAERLRAFLKEEPELPGSLRAQINRLHELEGQSPSIIPSAER
jgi:hypothetical protein